MVWGCMTWEGVGDAAKIDGRMDGDLYLQILKDELQNSIRFYGLNPSDVIFQQDNDPKHTCKKVAARRSRSGWMCRNLGLWYGLHSLLTSTPYHTSGGTSKGGLQGMSSPLREYRSCGEGLRRNGARYQLRCVRD